MPIWFDGRATPARRSSSSMISWWTGSASSPQGRGQCGATQPGLGQLASGGLRVLGQPGPHLEAAGIVVGRQSKSIDRDASWRRPSPGAGPPPDPYTRRAPTGAPRSPVPTASRGTHDGLELRHPVGARGRRACPTPPRCPRATAPSPGASSTAGPTAWPPPCSAGGAQPPGQGGPVPLQLPRVPRVGVRRLQGRAGPGQHELPLRGRRAGLPVGQRRRRGRRLPRLVHRAHRAHPRPPAQGDHLALGRRRQRPAAPTGPLDYEAAAATDTGRVVARRGPGRRRPAAHVHRRHHRHAQGRDVASGLAGQGGGVERQPAVPGRGRLRRRPPAAGRPGRRAGPLLPAPPAHARHRAVHHLHHPVDGRRGRAAAGRAPSTPAEMLDEVSARRVQSLIIVGDAFAKPMLRGARRRAGPLGPLQPGHGHLVGRDVERAGQAGAAAPQPQHAAHRRVLVVGGPGPGGVGVLGPSRRPARPSSAWARRRG